MNNEIKTLPIPFTVLNELKGFELVAWVIATKFFIFNHNLESENTLPKNTTIEEWYNSLYINKEKSQILEAFNSLKEKGYINNNLLRCHTTAGEWSTMDNNSFEVWSTGNNYTAEIKSFGGFLSVSSNAMLTTSFYATQKEIIIRTTQELEKKDNLKRNKNFNYAIHLNFSDKYNTLVSSKLSLKNLKKNGFASWSHVGNSRYNEEIIDFSFNFSKCEFGKKKRSSSAKKEEFINETR